MASKVDEFAAAFCWQIACALRLARIFSKLALGRTRSQVKPSKMPTALRFLLASVCAIAILFGAIATPPALAWPTSSLNIGFSANINTLLPLETSVNDLEELRQLIDQYRSGVSKERDRLQNLEKAAQDKLDNLEETLESTGTKLSESEAKLKQAAEKLTQLREDLATAERGYQEKRAGTVARLRFLQRQKGIRGWAILLQSEDLSEFMGRRHQLKRVYVADSQILQELKGEADKIETQKLAIEAQKNEIALIAEQLLNEKTSLTEQTESQKSLIARLSSDRKALEAAEDRLARDSRNLGIFIQQRVAARSGSGPIVWGTGQMLYPANARITSRFGWRVHPILGSRRFHAGIDFGASHGSTIRAADSGTVIFAGWYGGYGNAVVIDHGNGITTLYGHSSQLYVSEGQGVQKGQPIAAVGSTGLSTGPHLHFEVRLNGKPVDPLAYL